MQLILQCPNVLSMNRKSIPVIICAVLPVGERWDFGVGLGSHDGESDSDSEKDMALYMYVEEVMGASRQIAQEFAAMYVDLHTDIWKHQEKVNLDNRNIGGW